MTSRSSSWPWRAASPDRPAATERPVTLVQIDLRRGRGARPSSAAPAAVLFAVSDTAPTLARVTASPALVLGVGMVLLMPLAEPAMRGAPTLALLLIGLAVLGLLAVLLRPVHPKVGP